MRPSEKESLCPSFSEALWGGRGSRAVLEDRGGSARKVGLPRKRDPPVRAREKNRRRKAAKVVPPEALFEGGGGVERAGPIITRETSHM